MAFEGFMCVITRTHACRFQELRVHTGQNC